MYNEFRHDKYYIKSDIEGSCIHGYDSPALDQPDIDMTSEVRYVHENVFFGILFKMPKT